MTNENIRKIMFMMFEESLLDDIIKTYRNYKYLINDKSLDFMLLIAKCYTSQIKDSTKVGTPGLLEYLREMWDFEPTMEFPNPRGSVRLICEESISKGKINKTQIPEDYLKVSKNNVYVSPGYKLISINGQNYDEQLSLSSLLNTNIGDKVIFRENIDKVDDPFYKNHLKLVHCINSIDVEYSKEPIEFFLNAEGYPSKDQLSPYLLIIDLLEAKIRLNATLDTTLVDSLNKLLEKLKNTIHSLDVINLKFSDKIECLKELKSQKDYLISVGLPKKDVETHLDRLLKV